MEEELQFHKLATLSTFVFGSVPLAVKGTYIEFSQERKDTMTGTGCFRFHNKTTQTQTKLDKPDAHNKG